MGRRLHASVPVTLAARSLLALVLLLALGCAEVQVPTVVERQPSAAEPLLARADRLVGAGDARAAQYLYQRVVREFAGDPAAALALYRLGRLGADSASGLRNYRAAYGAFSQLLAQYPQSAWTTEAQAWHATLAELLAREDEATRLKQQLRWREVEAAELKLQLQQLRTVDLTLERRR